MVTEQEYWQEGNRIGLIVTDEISRDVVRVERRQGRFIMAWVIVKQQLVCIMSAYETNRRVECKKKGI